MNPERLAGLRAIGPFSALQVAPTFTEEDQVDLLTIRAAVTPGGAVQPLAYHGGPTLTAPKLVAIYAGNFYADKAQNDRFLHEVMTGGYLTALSGQGSGNGQFLGSYNVALPGAHVDDAECQALIAAAIDHIQGIPQPDGQTIYMLILPDGVSVGDGTPGNSSCTAFCGYHSSTDRFLYTIQPATTCPGCTQGDSFAALTMVEAHEIAESCSDPHGSGWFNDQTGMENADECAWVPIQWGPWTVQGYAAAVGQGGAWINAVGPYAPVATPQPPPTFVPNPAIDAWMVWQAKAAAWAQSAYEKGNIPAAAAAQASLVRYVPAIEVYFAAHAALLAEPIPDIPSESIPG